MDARKFKVHDALVAELLPEKGADLVISAIKTRRRMNDRRQFVTRLAVFFQNHKLPLVLNNTNLDSVIELHGPDTDAWPDKTVHLYKCRVQLFGEPTDAIRISAAGSHPAAPEEEEENETDST